MRLSIDRDYQGSALPEAHRAWLELTMGSDWLEVAFDAPYFGDPPPPSIAGSTDRLWEYEVIELFIAGPGERYLELELGPHGHHLGLALSGVRRVERHGLPIDVAVRIDACADLGPHAPVGRYAGRARVPTSCLPEHPSRVNAYLIHGLGAARCHHAHAPVAGPTPDFHRLDCFVPLRG